MNTMVERSKEAAKEKEEEVPLHHKRHNEEKASGLKREKSSKAKDSEDTFPPTSLKGSMKKKPTECLSPHKSKSFKATRSQTPTKSKTLPPPQKSKSPTSSQQIQNTFPSYGKELNEHLALVVQNKEGTLTLRQKGIPLPLVANQTNQNKPPSLEDSNQKVFKDSITDPFAFIDDMFNEKEGDEAKNLILSLTREGVVDEEVNDPLQREQEINPEVDGETHLPSTQKSTSEPLCEYNNGRRR
ncbi:hypothetical protein E6C27_scaffold4358G00290 [Cucumis melo var. makuwa]|uniref:Uncharacterized protein n=1 Tax=Cucumis melo var. makuwa TaxID=1194695 RepID=A0A5A7U397_CUCMM|nr:hypothetical protein E6C27_scaffold4358G00290 [Cucumis melo var. makuwa]